MPQNEEPHISNESGNVTMSSTASPLAANSLTLSSSSSNSSSNALNASPNNTSTLAPASSQNNASPTQYGYTIGATNILFKQRLYEELDAFVDETEIDLKQNEQLKKQLQLTTADIRFADYIIKNVNATRIKEQSRVNSGESNTPTLLSFRKTMPPDSLASNLDEMNKSSRLSGSSQNLNRPNGASSSDDLTASSWEGSDDWIRLNFKWFLYFCLFVRKIRLEI